MRLRRLLAAGAWCGRQLRRGVFPYVVRDAEDADILKPRGVQTRRWYAAGVRCRRMFLLMIFLS